MLSAPYKAGQYQAEPQERDEFLEFLDGLEGLNMARLRLLLAVAKRPRMHASYYAWLLGVDASALCKVARSMTDEGYYSRGGLARGMLVQLPSVDRRQKLLALSERGRELLRRIVDELGHVRGGV
jgi:DNA-binding MarR family transcriptional regulator